MLESDVLIGVVYEDRENLRVGMAKFKRIEFNLFLQDHASDIHSKMGSTVWFTDLVSFFSEAPSRTRGCFDAALVKKPKIHARIAQKHPDQFNEAIYLFFILAIRLGARDFQTNILVVKPQHECSIACLQLTARRKLSMKLTSGPVVLIDLMWM